MPNWTLLVSMLAFSQSIFLLSANANPPSCDLVGGRRVQVDCPAAAGTMGQCTKASTGAVLVSLLLSTKQSEYSTCQDVLNAYTGGTLQGLSLIHI